MPKTTPAPEKPTGPTLELVPMALINEPEVPVRSTMADQAMADLVESMAANGLLSPISVRPAPHQRYEIIYGHRRYLAARQLRWTEIRALVVTDGAVPVEAARIHENAFREDVNPADEAIYLAQAQEAMSLDLEGLCKLTRRSEEWVNQRFDLLRGDQDVFEALRHGAIPLGVARELNRLKDPALRKDYLGHAAVAGWSAKETHRWVEQANAIPAAGTPAVPPAPTATDVEPPPVVQNSCHLCKGSGDPQNLQWVLWHTYCLDHFDKALKQVEKAGE